MRLLALLAALLYASSPSLEAACHAPPKPRIDFVGTLTGCAPGTNPCAALEQINFFAKTESGSYAACDRFDWDFGDGSPHSTLQNPTHVFSTTGSYPVFLLITNDTGLFEGVARTVAVVATVLPGVVFFTASPSPVGGGRTVVLSWNTTNTPKGVRIENVHASSVPAAFKVTKSESIGSTSFIAQKTMSYTLTAIGDAASYTTPPVTVEVAGASRGRAARH